MTKNPVADPGWLSFDIHGRVRMGVARSAPAAAQLRTMFADFLTDESDGPFDLTVTGEMQPVHGAAYAEDTFSYTPSAICLRTPPLQIIRDGTCMRLNGPGELLTTVLPLLDRILVERGIAMIHAATVSIDGDGVALPASGGVGKTSTIAKLMRCPGVGFMEDDWAFVSAEGALLGFAKPMFIRPHHRTIYPHLFHRMRKPMVRSAPLSAAVYVERYDGAEPRLSELHQSAMAARMLGNFHIEMTMHSREVLNLLGATGLVPLQDIFADKATILGKALQNVPTFLLQVPVAYDADHASDVIVEQLAAVTTPLGVPAESGS